jgi:AraC-like DNA-binding protein
MDNYYAGDEAQRMRWVLVSFFAALSIGVLAMLNAIFMTGLGALLFSVVMIAFYFVFGIRFLNYPVLFSYIETAIAPDESEDKPTDAPAVFAALEGRIAEWVANKEFTEEGITIERLANRIYTNRHYLSSYINSSQKQTFRNWMNELRMEEAKELLLQYPDMTVGEIALRVGIPDRSNFTRRFSKQTGLSPQVWRKQAASK